MTNSVSTATYTFRYRNYHIYQIRVVEREMQEYHENEDAKEAQKNLDADEQPPVASLSSNVDRPETVPIASN